MLLIIGQSGCSLRSLGIVKPEGHKADQSGLKFGENVMV